MGNFYNTDLNVCSTSGPLPGGNWLRHQELSDLLLQRWRCGQQCDRFDNKTFRKNVMLSFPGYQQWPGGVKKSKWAGQDKKNLLPIGSEEAKAWQWKGKDFQSDQLQFDICFQTTFSSYLKRRLWKRQLSRTNLYNYQDDTAIFKGSQINPQLVFRGSQVKCQWKTGTTMKRW